MSGNADADLREEVRSRYAAAARAVMEPKSGAPAGCCDGSQASSCCGTEPDSDPADVFRVLVPGGRIGISDVVAEDRLTPADRAAAGSYVGCIAGALSRAEYLAGLAAAGFADASVTFTTEAASGIHSATIRAIKPASS